MNPNEFKTWFQEKLTDFIEQCDTEELTAAEWVEELNIFIEEDV
jgi:hypothetical protein